MGDLGVKRSEGPQSARGVVWSCLLWADFGHPVGQIRPLAVAFFVQDQALHRRKSTVSPL
ncbi:hypothetical protein DS909_02705 [Phaeobacter gallaeciensis]|uniref:Uncharacterized protein n=1 Tax=Phaeobacter gallaeciensis TaxID=60890 RepID=A0A366XD29_9RHOB|nr:hypothetical protein DS909_02705 [Phaeobacter gallaeciensis]